MIARLSTSLIFLFSLLLSLLPSTHAAASDFSCDGTNRLNQYNLDLPGTVEQPFLRITPTSCDHFGNSVKADLKDSATTDAPVLGTISPTNDLMHVHWKSGGNVSGLTLDGQAVDQDKDVELWRFFSPSQTTYTIKYQHATAGTRQFTFQLMNNQEDFVTTSFTVSTPAPVLTTVTPNTTNLGGGTVVIAGDNFTAASAVQFDGVDAVSFTVDSPTQITAVVPPRNTPGGVSVSVTNPGSTTAKTGLFSYTAGTAGITGITPSSGPNTGGTAVTITGTNLTGATDVKIGGTSATSIVVVSDTEITAVTPAGPLGAADVEVTVPAGVQVATGIFTYVESTEKTQRIIASYLQDRATNLLNTRPDITNFLYTDIAGGPLGNLQLNAGSQDFNLTFTSSLGRIMRATQSEPDAEGQLSSTNGYDNRELAGEGKRDYDLWVQIHGAKTRTTEANSTLWVGQFGGHKFLDENTLVGAMVQLDWADQTQRTTTGSVDGLGWMVGPYFAAKMPDQSLAFDAFATWGRSDNNVSPDGTYTDKFETERWMANAKLSGVFEANGWTIQPAIEVSYFKETQFSYIDSQNSTIPEQSISMGELRFGPSISKQWELEDGTIIRPSVGVTGVWNFAVDREGLFPASGQTSNDIRARFEVGLTIAREDEWSLDVSGFYDGVGTDGFESYGGKLRLSVPLP